MLLHTWWKSGQAHYLKFIVRLVRWNWFSLGCLYHMHDFKTIDTQKNHRKIERVKVSGKRLQTHSDLRWRWRPALGPILTFTFIWFGLKGQRLATLTMHLSFFSAPFNLSTWVISKLAAITAVIVNVFFSCVSCKLIREESLRCQLPPCDAECEEGPAPFLPCPDSSNGGTWAFDECRLRLLCGTGKRACCTRFRRECFRWNNGGNHFLEEFVRFSGNRKSK